MVILLLVKRYFDKYGFKYRNKPVKTEIISKVEMKMGKN